MNNRIEKLWGMKVRVATINICVRIIRNTLIAFVILILAKLYFPLKRLPMPLRMLPPPPFCLNWCTSCWNRSSCSRSNDWHFLSLKMFGNCNLCAGQIFSMQTNQIPDFLLHFRQLWQPQRAHWSLLLIPPVHNPQRNARRQAIDPAPFSTPKTRVVPNWSVCSCLAEKTAKNKLWFWLRKEDKIKYILAIHTYI